MIKGYVWLMFVLVVPTARAQDPPGAPRSSGIAAQIQTIQNSLPSGALLNSEQSSRLLYILGNPLDGFSVREEALLLLCERAAPPDGARLVALLDTWISKARTRRSGDGGDAADLHTGVLLETFFKDGARQLSLKIADPRSLLDLYIKIYEPKPLDWYLWTTAGDRIADNPAPLAVRQEYMLRVLRVLPRPPVPTFDPLLDENVAPALRELAFDAPEGVTIGNLSAFDLLIQSGDLETARRLEEKTLALGGDLEVLRRPGGAIWSLRGKHDPKMLLDHIRSTEPETPEASSSRRGALVQAIRNGVERGAIRQALLERLRNCKRSDLEFQFRVWDFSKVTKHTPWEHQVLTTEDLAELRKRLDETEP